MKIAVHYRRASQPPERQLTGTPTTHAKIMIITKHIMKPCFLAMSLWLNTKAYNCWIHYYKRDYYDVLTYDVMMSQGPQNEDNL